MSLLALGFGLGLLPAWRGGMLVLLGAAWAVAGVIVSAMVFAPGDAASTLLAIAIVVAGFNAGIVSGLCLAAATSRRLSA